MKTVVLGLFDQIDDARRVLAHLAALPLDMDAIQVVHPDPDTQRRMAAEANLPPRQGLRNGAVLGALLGAALGFMASSPGMGGPLPLVAGLGPLLTLAAGAVLGGVLGAVGGAMSETVRLPEAHQQAVIDALSAGATVVMVHTESLPTAKALGDLFRDSGSRVLPALAEAEAGAGPGGTGPAAGARTGAAGWSATAGPVPPEDTGRWLREDVPAEHQAFAPPWRRGEGDADDAAAGGGDGGVAGADMAQVAPSSGDGSAAAVIEDVHGADEGGAVGAGTIGDAGVAEAPAASAEEAVAGAAWSAPTEGSDVVALEDLGLAPRIARPLAEAGIVNLAELRRAAADPDGLLALRGIGPAALVEIRRVVDAAEG